MEREINVPKLRFQEFEGVWKLNKLSSLSDFLDGRRKPIKESERNLIKGIYPYYGASGIIDYVNDYIFDEEVILLGEDGENIISRNSPLAFKVTGRCWINNHAHVIKPKSNTNIDFLIQSLERISYVKYNTGTAQPKLNQEICKGIELFSTSIAEQTKIASFLSSVDDNLSQLKKKKRLLEQYKKGVMQKIFSQELRFKDDNGNDFADWDDKLMADITFKVGKKNKEAIQYPIYSINNKDGFKPQSEQFDGVDSNTRGYDISMYKIIEKNTFAYNPARINVGSIGYSGDLNNIIISSLYVCFKTTEEVDDLFLSQYVCTPIFNKAVLTNVEGGVREYLFYENFSSIAIFLPDIPEQTKIANFLSAIDDKINQCGKQFEKMEMWKKGLMQQMFC